MIEGVTPTHPIPVELEAFSVHAPGGFITPALSFNVGRGERLGLAGESGCGKTTVLDRLAGLVRPAPYRVSGMCRVEGKVGYVPQDPLASLSPFLSIIRQVAHIAGSEETARGWLERVGLDSRRTQQARPHQLSGGERQRVLMAMALCARPDVLLADEPVAHLDRATQDAVLALLDGEAAAAGAALVVASHQEDVFTRLGCRVERMTSAPGPLSIPLAHGGAIPAVQISALTKTYRQRGFLLQTRHLHRALDGVTLEIHGGETVVLCGASGSGKSTLARCLAARERPDSGSIVLPAGGGVQLVDQEPSGCINPRFTVAEAIAEATSEPCDELLAEMNLPESWETRRISTLSEGQRARVALARAMAAARGGLLILDETLGSLDDATAGAILQAVARRQSRVGLACLLITHDLRFHQVHRRLTMSNGRLVA